MSSLDNVVKINITRATRVPSRVGFGKGAFVSDGAVFPELVREYSNIDAVTEDFTAGLVDQRVVDAATRHFSQTLKPETFFVIKKGEDRAHVQLITFSGEFVTGNIINMDVDGNAVGPVNFTTDSDTTLAALATAIQAEAKVATAVSNPTTNSILVTGANVNEEVPLTNLVVTGGASQPTGTISLVTYFDEVKTYVESIVRSRDVVDDWYIVMIESKALADQEAVADYIEPLVKLFAFATSDANAKDGSSSADIFSILKGKSYDRSFGLYSAQDTLDPDMGWTGGQLPKDPGSLTWAHKEIKGITADNLNDTDYKALLAKSANVYVEIAQLSHTQFGTVVSGEYVDVMRGIDFIHVRMQEAVFALKQNNDKIPYTNKGIALVQNEMDKVLRNAVNQGIINDGYTITVPDAATVPTADKAARELKNMRFDATLQGAIHKTTIDGNVSL